MQIPHGTMIAQVDARGFRLFRNAGNEATPRIVPAEGAVPAGDLATTAAWLNAQVESGAIDLLITVAQPAVLAELRGHLAEATVDTLICEIPADVIGMEGLEALAALQDG